MLTNLSSLNFLSLQNCNLEGKFLLKNFMYIPYTSPKKKKSWIHLNLYDNIWTKKKKKKSWIHLNLYNNNFIWRWVAFFHWYWIFEKIVIIYSCNFSSSPKYISYKDFPLLGIRSCNFLGQLPFSISNLTQLNYLDLSFNKFSSPTSSLSWIGMNTKLTYLDLSNIKLYWWVS